MFSVSSVINESYNFGSGFTCQQAMEHYSNLIN